MGHSFGGAVAQEYARLYPEKLKAMILIGTGTRFKLSQAYRKAHEKGMDVQNISAGDMPLPIRRGYEMLKKVSGPALHADQLAAGAFDSTPWIASVEVPALVLWGSSDFITPRELPETLARMLPKASFQVIEGSGHVLMVEAPAAFNTTVSEFMSRIENP